MEIEAILITIKKSFNQRNREGMARFGIPSVNAVGMSSPQMRELAKKIGKNHELALALWKTDLYEAKIIATLIDEPVLLTEGQMCLWTKDFNSWALCDATCFNLFRKNDLSWNEVYYFAKQKEEFVKRTAFSLIAGLVSYRKEAKDDVFVEYLDLCYRNTEDPRIYVRKAVNWAIRQIGKRDILLNKKAIEISEKIRLKEDRTSNWIAGDALRELKNEKIQNRLREKSKK
jgi:3-methyladenine DNA glycosylase AlkD